MGQHTPGLPDYLNDLRPSGFTRSLELFDPRLAAGQGVLFNPSQLRGLSQAEIGSLEGQGNCCADWSLIRVSQDFTPVCIRNNLFSGQVILGSFDGRPCALPQGGQLPSGIYQSTIQDSEIAPGCAIHRCPLIAHTAIAGQTLCLDSTITHSGQPSTFGNGQRIRIGIETGGRETWIFADLSLDLAEFLLRHPHRQDIQKAMKSWLDTWLAGIARPYTVICESCTILSSRIRDSYLGPRACLDGALMVEHSTIGSSAADPVTIGAGCILRTTVIQEGVKVLDGAITDCAMLFEHSDVTQHGKAVESLIGPNSGVSKGETTASFLGPFVGFHHQSLLIAAFWPGGRGNIAYGANVGSNHTSRVPDQEFWPGEGMFFGLGCSVKYPANFSHAPYTIIAAGVATLPQRLCFPFSLINEPVGYYLEVPPGFNNLIPAWGLSENLYSLYRNEGKYKARNKAKRNIFDLNLFRPEILAYMHEAVRLLKNIQERKTIYLPGDIPGIGKNMLTDENRLKAIEAYEFFLELQRLRSEARQLAASPALAFSSRHEQERHAAQVSRLTGMLPQIVRGVESSRTRDFDRGCAIIDDYAHTHQKVDADPFVLQTRSEIQAETTSLQILLDRIRSAPVQSA